MQLASGDIKEARTWYHKLLPWAKLPAKPSRYFPLWFKRLGGTMAGVARRVVRLGRPKLIPDHQMLAIAKGPLQRPYYSHGTPHLPISVEEVISVVQKSGPVDFALAASTGSQPANHQPCLPCPPCRLLSASLQ